MAETNPAEIRTVESTMAVFAGVITKDGDFVVDPPDRLSHRGQALRPVAGEVRDGAGAEGGGGGR